MDFKFEITHKAKNCKARAGIIHTKNGIIETPYLIPVATRGRIETLESKDLEEISPQAVLSNTYHLHFKPGEEKISKKGGLHNFIPFKGPIFTDSGGFQVMSLGKGKLQSLRKVGFLEADPNQTSSKYKDEKSFVSIKEKGIEFISVYDNKKYFMGPKESMEIQSKLGADIIMAFDECPSRFESQEYIKESMIRSHKWEEESLKFKDPKQALYGIIHGGWFKDLRMESAKFINSLSFEGVAIGGALGDTKEQMHKVLDWIIPLLDERPRHMLGIGRVDDLFECIERGIDTFDCVDTTRIARHGHLLISPKSGGNLRNKFRIEIKRSQYKDDENPIDKECLCKTCKNYSKKELRKLYKSKDPEYARLATIHNITFMENLTKKIRDSIKQDNFKKLKSEWIK